MREIVIGTETTGLDPLGGDRIVEIGAVELVNRSLTGETTRLARSTSRHRAPSRSEITKPTIFDLYEQVRDNVSPLELELRSYGAIALARAGRVADKLK